MAISSEEFDFVRRIVLEDSSIVLEQGKEYLVESRLGSLACELGMAEVSALLTHLRTSQDAETRRQIVEAMTTNETSFFRDQHPFDALHNHLIPDLMKTREQTRTLNILCAACSTGQEPYSIAMLMADRFPQLSNWNLCITATDIAEAILTKAKEATFSLFEVNRGLPAPLLVKHFEQDGNRWKLKESIRDMVQFRQLNLAGEWPVLPRMDLVFLRNVLIYFDIDTKRKILETVAEVLQPDGTLFLGAAETTLGLCDLYERIPVGKTTCYRVQG